MMIDLHSGEIEAYSNDSVMSVLSASNSVV